MALKRWSCSSIAEGMDVMTGQDHGVQGAGEMDLDAMIKAPFLNIVDPIEFT